MRNSENHKKHVQLFHSGANHDINADVSGITKDGFYRDARNMRLSNVNSNSYALERIKGETIKYNGVSSDYTCIAAIEVNFHVVEIWVQDDNSHVIFRIDGIVMLDDSDNQMNLSHSTPLQIHKNDSCNGGEFYFVDNVNPPYIYSVQDIIDKYNAGSQIYFSDFNPLLYQTVLTLPLNHPVFVELVNVGAGGGLYTGQYSYSFRFVDDDGNRTNFSPPTPLIPVVENVDEASTHFPSSRTYGGVTNLVTPTKYGVKIRFRIDNRLNYNYIEIGRVAWNQDSGLGYVPSKEYYRLPTSLSQGQFSTIDFTDIDGLTWEVITDNEETEQLGAIVTAKAIRYFNGQLVLGNLTYASRDLDGSIEFKSNNGNLASPFIDNIGVHGYSNPYNSVYKKQYMSGERYGFGVACYDDQGSISLVLPIDDGVIDLLNYQFPNRREQCSARTLFLSDTNWKGVPRMADIDGNVNVPIHEKFMFDGNYIKTGNDLKSLKAGEYGVLSPKYYSDSYTDHNYHVNIGVAENVSTSGWGLGTEGSYDELSYNPDKYSPNIYATGIAIEGLVKSSIPSWVSAFSIVRTKPAGRVVAQGLSMYDMFDSPQTETGVELGGVYNIISKTLNSVWFYSDDVNNGLTSIQTNSEVQFVSPLGYFSEVYMNMSDGTTPYSFNFSRSADMVVYANQYYTSPSSSVSPKLYQRNNGTSSYWTKFGQWRNVLATGSIFDVNDGNAKLTINGASLTYFKGVGRNNYYELFLSGDIYSQTQPQSLPASGTMQVNHAGNQDWQEPFYVTNIVNEGKNIVSNNITEYILTGNLQKISSVIGYGTGTSQSIVLVDERWDDCVVNPYAYNITTQNVFIYITDINTGIKRAWVDVTYKSDATRLSIASDITTNGYWLADDGVGGTVRVYGMYSATFVDEGNVTINFSVLPSILDEYTIPATSTEITVEYDDRFPIKVFGGDTVIGNSYFSPIDGLSTDDGKVDNNNQLYMWTGFPYPAYKFNSNYKVTANTTNILGNMNFQNQRMIPIGIVRQMLVSFISESRTHIPYYYNEYTSGSDSCDSSLYNDNNCFPRVNYIMRPLKWKNDCSNNFGGSKVDTQYQTDYPGEATEWIRGGFRTTPMFNRDYSHYDSFKTLFNKPIVGFTEKTKFCSRVAWSLKRNINEQNDPNLKTFTALNVFDISDSNQEIKFLYDNDSDKGNNLIAITGNGICLLITDKRIISQISGNDLIYLDPDKLVSGEYWLSKSIGCNNEMWRGIAEYDNQLYFPNSESVYRLNGLQIQDILRNANGGYYSRLYPVLKGLSTDYTDRICSVYDVLHNEYWLHVSNNRFDSIYSSRILNLKDDVEYVSGATTLYDVGSGNGINVNHSSPVLRVILPDSTRFNNGDYFYFSINSNNANMYLGYSKSTPISTLQDGFTYLCTYNDGLWSFVLSDFEYSGATFVFNNSLTIQAWTGYYDYNADKMLNVYGKDQKNLGVLLMRDYDTYDTNISDIINGNNITGSILFDIASREPHLTKEFIDQTFNCNQSPTYCEYSNYDIGNIEGTQSYFKNYTHGYYVQIPRKDGSGRYRFQGRHLTCRVSCDTIGDWVVSMVETGYKDIR